MCIIYTANAFSDYISQALALLAEKRFGFSVPTSDFIHMKETQHESNLNVKVDHK